MLALATLALSYVAPPPRTIAAVTTHVAATGETGDAFIRPTDLHVFASDPSALPTNGGAVAVSNTNGTVEDYTMSFGPLVTSSGSGPWGTRNITAVMTTTKDGTCLLYTSPSPRDRG